MRDVRKYLIAYAIFLVLFFIVHHPYYWDAGIYAGMGKFIFSAGKIGIWEAIRPPVLPAIEGLVWWLGLPFPLAGQLISFLFSLALPFLVYKVGTHAFGEEQGKIAALITAFHPLLLYFNSSMLTTVPSLCFVLAAFWALYEGHTISSGALMGIATLTRYPAALFFIPALVLLFCNRGHLRYKQIIYFILSFGVIVSFQLLLNGILFGQPLQPLLDAQAIVQEHFSTVWYDYFPWVILELITTGMGIYIMRHRWRLVVPMALTVLVPMIYFTMIAHKEPRYIALMVPFFALWASVNVVRLKKYGYILAIGVICLLWFVEGPRLLELYPSENVLTDYGPINGMQVPVVTTSPVHLFFLNTPTYLYHLQTFAKTKEMIQTENISFIYNTCDIVCIEANEFCEPNKANALKHAQRHLREFTSISKEICSTTVFIPGDFEKPKSLI